MTSWHSSYHDEIESDNNSDLLFAACARLLIYSSSRERASASRIAAAHAWRVNGYPDSRPRSLWLRLFKAVAAPAVLPATGSAGGWPGPSESESAAQTVTPLKPQLSSKSSYIYLYVLILISDNCNDRRLQVMIFYFLFHLTWNSLFIMLWLIIGLIIRITINRFKKYLIICLVTWMNKFRDYLY